MSNKDEDALRSSPQGSGYQGATFVNPGPNAALQITQVGNAPASTSVGGSINLDNSLSTGAGLVVFSSQAAPAGRLIVGRSSNAAFSQTVAFFQQAGTGHALHADLTQTNSSTASALNITSANTANSAVFVSGVETARGTVKITHTGTGTDANAAALSIDLQGSGTASQGIFMDSTVAGGTTGNLMDLRNNGNQLFKFSFDATTKAIPILILGNGGPTIQIGAGVPAVAAPVGSLFLRTDGGAVTTLYVKESGTGTAGWVAK